MSALIDDNTPHLIGWHDSHCASAAVLSRSGRILYAAAEERFTKNKLQKGCPSKTLQDIGKRFPQDQARRCYVDMPLPAKVARNCGLLLSSRLKGLNTARSATGQSRCTTPR